MKERPIIFSGPMVRAILDGRKTMTRRIVKFKLCPDLPVTEISKHGPFRDQPPNMESWSALHSGDKSDVMEQDIKCPYGIPGDRLWVRETFRVERPFTGDLDHDLTTSIIRYYADDHPKYRDQDKWKPSIHMPRWASRILLEVEAVRVERLNDISSADACAEGSGSSVSSSRDVAREMFSQLWNSIHGEDAWYDEPWVWVINFKRQEAVDG